MDSSRDWGHSRDYVRAMVKILGHEKADDFVIATGQTHTVRQLVETVFTSLDLDYRDFVTQNPKFLRPEELPYLKGDASKARQILDWTPTVTFEELVNEMVTDWMNKLQRG